MDWPNCIRCDSTRTVPGGFSEPAGAEAFFVDASVAKRRAMFQVNHIVQLDGDAVARLCLDCGLAWQETNADSLRDLQTGLREKCHPEFRSRLFGD